MLRPLAPALLALFAATEPLVAQTATIRGRVSDAAGAALARAQITVVGTTLRAQSDDGGDYTLAGVPAGERTVRVRLIGYVPSEHRITARTGSDTRLDVRLVAQPIGLAAIDVVVGSRARHTAAEELAVPVDVFDARDIRAQGTTEAAAILSQLSPSVNFPRQSIADATDIVRPFTLRGLSPDHNLVLINGKRRHRTALVHYFGAALGAGSSGVDMNALPSSAFERIEMLRDGAAAQYGSDAIAGVANVVLREGAFAPTFTADVGRYVTGDFPDDGDNITVSGAYGFRLGRGSLAVFGEARDRGRTDRACPEPVDMITTGDADVVQNCRVTQKNNPVPQPNYHWGDGESRDYLLFANGRVPVNPAATAELYTFGGFSTRDGSGNGFFRYPTEGRNFTNIYPNGYLPEFRPDVVDYSVAAGLRGIAGAWRYDASVSVAGNDFEFNLQNTMNASLGPCLQTVCAPGPDRTFGTPDDPLIPNQTSFFAGELKLGEQIASLDLSRAVNLGGLPNPLNLALGAAFRRETYRIGAGERASWIDGGHLGSDSTPVPAGSQVFPGLQPSDEADVNRTNLAVYVEAETNLSRVLLVNAAGRFEDYSDFGSAITGKLALRLQPSSRVTLRGAVSTGFRAPSLSQSHYSQTVTNFQNQVAFQVGIFPVASAAARALGATPLQEETSLNLSGGVAFSPTPELNLTADLYWIEVKDRILMTAELDDDSLRARMTAAGAPSVSRARYFTNALDTRTRGLDVTANWERTLGGARRVGFNLAVNYNRTRVVDSLPLPPQLQNTASPVGRFDTLLEGGLNALERERPEWRGALTGRLTDGRMSILLRGAYYGRYFTSLVNYTGPDTLAAKVVLDAEISRLFGQGVTVAVGARNLLDTYPDQVTTNNSFDVLVWPTASPFGFNGRFVYARMEVALR